MVRLTVVNDNPEILDLMGEILEGDHYVTTLLESVHTDLLRRICQSEPDLLMIDLRHGDDAWRGWEIVQELRTTPGCERLPIVLCSADIPALNEVEAELEAVPDIVTLQLPFEVDGVLQSIRTLIGRRETSTCS